MAIQTVIIEKFRYSPPVRTVHQGDTITWVNKDASPHSATSDDGSFDTGLIDPGAASDPVRIDRAPGNIRYHDTQPDSAITGVVVVTL